MKDTLLYILKNIVDSPDEVSVEETANEGKTTLVIHVAQDDIGKVIGKHGRIIRALRDLMKILAVKKQTYVDVVLSE